jgi:hypothetical protein
VGDPALLRQRQLAVPEPLDAEVADWK